MESTSEKPQAEPTLAAATCTECGTRLDGDERFMWAQGLCMHCDIRACLQSDVDEYRSLLGLPPKSKESRESRQAKALVRHEAEQKRMVTFRKMCHEAKAPNDFFTIVDWYVTHFKDPVKSVYNATIGWALPHRATCALIVDFWKREGNRRRIVDLGCGSGLFCMLLHHCGIPADRLFAVDKVEPTHETGTYKPQWPIHRDDCFDVPPGDILFIAWGSHSVTPIVERYVEQGGTCVVILGEADCTFDCDYFSENKLWKVRSHHVPGPASQLSEFLTFNQRKQ